MPRNRIAEYEDEGEFENEYEGEGEFEYEGEGEYENEGEAFSLAGLLRKVAPAALITLGLVFGLAEREYEGVLCFCTCIGRLENLDVFTKAIKPR